MARTLILVAALIAALSGCSGPEATTTSEWERVGTVAGEPIYSFCHEGNRIYASARGVAAVKGCQ